MHNEAMQFEFDPVEATSNLKKATHQLLRRTSRFL
jgi:hypothetical protein